MPRSVYPPAAVCSSWLFLSFFRRLGSLMIPACHSDVCLTPSGALCEDNPPPHVCVRAQNCPDHFISWDKPVFQSLQLPGGGEQWWWCGEAENSKAGMPPQVTHVHVGSFFFFFPRRAFKSRIYFCYSPSRPSC